MNKITLPYLTLLVLIFIPICTFAQTESYSEAVDSGHEFSFTNGTATIISITGSGVVTYTDQTSFEDDYNDVCNEPLLYEDFAEMPVGITTCGYTISSAGDDCFAPGALIEGFVVTAEGPDPLLVSISPGSIGNTNPLVGANTFTDYTIVTFPDNNVVAVGQTLYNNSSATVDYRIYSPSGDLISSVTANAPAGAEVFFGFISDEPIGYIEIQGDADSGELIGNLQFGVCGTVSIQDYLAQSVTLFPNPVSDMLNIQLTNGVELNTVTVFDILGKNTGISVINGQMDVSSLQNGVYLISIETKQGTLTQKFVKK